jgi:hypothetical protein
MVVGLAPATRPRPVRVARKEMMYRRGVHRQGGWDLRRIFPAHLPRWRMQENSREAGTISCTFSPFTATLVPSQANRVPPICGLH